RGGGGRVGNGDAGGTGTATQGARIRTSTMMMDRTGMGMGMPGMGSMTMTGMGTAPMAPNMMMVPRCKMTVEKMQGGMKMTCTCDDAVARAIMQHLCTTLAPRLSPT